MQKQLLSKCLFPPCSFTFIFRQLPYCFCAFILLLLVKNIHGQNRLSKANFQFDHFTLPGGVLANQVSQIVQDEQGFLWIASKKGLFKYDGRRFKLYQSEKDNPNSLPTDYVEILHFDHEGMLWIGTYGKGLTKFNPKTEQFIPLDWFKQDSLGEYVFQIIEDSKQHIWAGTEEGLYKLNPKQKQVKFYRANPANPKALYSPSIWKLYIDQQETLWVGTGKPWSYNPLDGGLHKYNPNTDDFTRYLHDATNPNSLADNRIGDIFEDSQNNFWVGTMGEGLHLMNREEGTFQRLGPRHNYAINLNRPTVIDPAFAQGDFSQVSIIHEDKLGRLWVGAFNGGLNIYDPLTNQQIHFEAANNEKETNVLTTNFLFSLLETKDNTILIPSGDNGDSRIAKVRYSANVFKHHPLPKKDLAFGYVQNFEEDAQGNIWIGTMYGEGLFKWDMDKSIIESYSEDIPHKNINAISRNKEGLLWIGYHPQGIELWNPLTNTKLTHLLPKDLLNQLKQKPVNTVFEDSAGNTWIPTVYGEVFVWRPDNTYFALPDSTQGNMAIDRIYEDEKGDIYLFGYQKISGNISSIVINRFNSTTQQLESLLQEKQVQGFIPSLARDKNGHFWFPNTLDGIKKFNPITKEITSIHKTNSRIPSDEIRALLIDDNGIIWLTTKTQIIAFNPENEAFRIFDAIDGVSIELSYGAIFKRKNGHLLFGGKNGFLELDPKQFDMETQFAKPDIQIAELRVNNTLIETKHALLANQPIWETKELQLTYQQNSLTFGLSCLDYHTDENYIEFFLENYDHQWRKVGPEKSAIYVNVPPGKYLFKTRGANYKGGWNPAGQSINITIQQPWWQTWWFYTLCLMSLLSVAYSLYRFQLNRQKNIQEAKNLRKIDALKTKLYANITHEFRTPLTLILGLANQIEENKKNINPSTKAKIIRTNGERLLFLVNQLLDLRKLEIGQEKLQLIQGNILIVFHKACDNFDSLAESRNIKLLKEIPTNPIIMDFDEDKLNKVIYNLLANAIKFTKEGGKIIVTVKKTDNQLLFSVKDNGIGIEAQQLPNIFDRFYQTHEISTPNGTGIGLALTKELVELMKGSINVSSITKVGSEFTVVLPITNQANLEESFDVVNAPFPSLLSTFENEAAIIQSDDNRALILLVEDNPEIAHFTATCLTPYFNVQFAKNGAIGIEKAIDIVPDLIISDVMMPLKDGFQLCGTLKMDERTSHIPIILLTARVDVSDRLKGLKRGADAYLGKPFVEEELIIRVNQLIKQRNQLKIRYSNLEKQIAPTDEILKMEDAFVSKVRAVIEANLDNESFGVEDICQAIFLSRTQLHRKLKALTNKSTSQFIRTIRMHYAKIAIKQTDKPISTIAYEVGFKDPAYFTRVFTEMVGSSPTSFKAQHQKHN